MKRLIQLEYSVGDHVLVKDIEATGTVYAATVSRGGIEYQVKWFANSERHSDWFRGEELREAP